MINFGRKLFDQIRVSGLLQFSGIFRHRYQFKEEVTDDITLDAQDNGKLLIVTTDAKTITLPATGAAYGPYRIMNGGEDGDVLITISPNANDRIFGCDMGGDEDHDLLNTKATAKREILSQSIMVELLGGQSAK